MIILSLAVVANRVADPGLTIAFFTIVGLCGYGGWKFIHWLLAGPVQPDPWSAEIAAEISKDETPALCHRCLVPHDPANDFCPDCGAPVGPYTNWLPYPYVFSLGHTLRIGTSGDFKHSPITVIGFFLVSMAEYAIFAPVYWFVFLKNFSSRPPRDLPPSEPGVPPT